MSLNNANDVSLMEGLGERREDKAMREKEKKEI